MILLLEPIAETLKAARKRQGLSQRMLAAKAGVPQSHISKIENAAVDLQTTSLIAIARALGLELMLVPRQLVSAVESIEGRRDGTKAGTDLGKVREQLHHRTAELLRQTGGNPALDELRRSIDDLSHLAFDTPQALAFATLAKRTRQILSLVNRGLVAKRPNPIDKRTSQQIFLIARDFRSLRNSILEAPGTRAAALLPAYTLDDEDEDA